MSFSEKLQEFLRTEVINPPTLDWWVAKPGDLYAPSQRRLYVFRNHFNTSEEYYTNGELPDCIDGTFIILEHVRHLSRAVSQHDVWQCKILCSLGVRYIQFSREIHEDGDTDVTFYPNAPQMIPVKGT